MLDLSGPYQVAYDRVLPHAYQVADPFHVVRLANRCVDCSFTHGGLFE